MRREQWSSRPAFIVAAIGSAIGFGNVWRFPTLAYDYGGGAFFIPYLLALFIIGIPILILEIAVGQYYQTGDAGAFGKVNKRFRGVGLGSILCAFVVSTYYCVLLAYVLRMFVYSCIGAEGRWANVSGVQAYEWFQNTVAGLETVGPDFVPTRLVGANVGALAIVWLTVFLCIAFGVKWTGRIAFITVGLPVVLLLILVIRAATLEGARDGVKAYIGEWDVSILRDRPKVWSESVSQVFFSLGVTFGTMTAYASYNKRDAPVFSNSLIIAISNSLYSFMAGFAVFGTVGYLANRENIEISELGDILGGAGLMFGTYPVALSTLPGSGHWERLLFVALFMLGIDSAFALAEGVSTVFHDTLLFRNVRRVYVSAAVSLAGFIGGLLYCTDSGIKFLEVTDFYINFMMLLVGFFECFAIGWIYGIEEQIDKLGIAPVVGYLGATYGSICLASGLWFGLENDAVGFGFVGLAAAYLLFMAAIVFLLRREKKKGTIELTWREIVVELFMGNVLSFRRELVGIVKYIPLLWFFLIRHVVPPLLLILFANLSVAKTKAGETEFGHHGALPRGYQALGIFVFVVTCVVILTGAIFPDALACFDVSTVVDEKEELRAEAVEELKKEHDTTPETEQENKV